MKKSSTRARPAKPSDATGGIEPIAVSLEDGAKALGVGRTTICEMVRTNELPSFKIGKRRLLLLETLKAHARRLEQRTAA